MMPTTGIDAVKRPTARRWDKFKRGFIDENSKIAEIFRHRLDQYILPPILDVGAGAGDIAARAFPEKPTWLLDIEAFRNAPISKHHKRRIGDITNRRFNFPNGVRTIILSHVLQYLDTDVSALKRQIDRLAPKYVIEVRNDNTGVFGELVTELNEHLHLPNPEMPVTYLSSRFRMIRRQPFRARMAYRDFGQMADDFIELIMDAPLTHGNQVTGRQILKRFLSRPEIEFSQTVYVFSR